MLIIAHNLVVPIWGIVNQKGGVGKTTTAVNIAAALANRNQKTLLIDADPQGNATTGLGVDKKSVRSSLYDVFVHGINHPEDSKIIKGSIIQINKCLDLIPTTIDLSGAEAQLLTAVGKEYILKDAIKHVKDNYQWIIIDAPPSLGLITINVLSASHSVLVPMQSEFYALEGLTQLMKTIAIVKKRINPNLSIAKVLLTMYDNRSRLSKQVTEELDTFFGEKLSDIKIPKNVRLSEAPSFGKSAIDLYPTSKGTVAYQNFVDKIMLM